jgi:ligand-binding SRPBCC domain-containing protein
LVFRLSADSSAPGAPTTFHRDTVVPASVDRTFAFFADAANLERLTPPWLNFRILTRTTVVIQAGVAIDYEIRIHGFPIQWTSRIEVWEPGIRFVDRQIVGPYRWWNHEHRFEAVAGGTRVIDDIAYLPRFGWFTGGFVRRDLERIFAFRHNALHEIFASRGN